MAWQIFVSYTLAHRLLTLYNKHEFDSERQVPRERLRWQSKVEYQLVWTIGYGREEEQN